MTVTDVQPGLTAPAGGGGVADLADLVWQFVDSPAEFADLMTMIYDPPATGWTQAGRPRGERAKCGTNKAYKQHLYYGEQTDPECRKANAAYVAERKRIRNPPREKDGFVCGTMRAYKHHLELGEPTCRRCRAANAEYKGLRARGEDGRYTRAVPEEDPAA